MKTCFAIIGTLTKSARLFVLAIVTLVVATQSLAESSKCDAKDVATIPDGMQWGVTFGFYGSDEYFASQAARDEIDAISLAGANWVTVVATVWQDTCQSTFQYRDFDLTPSDLTLKGIIDLVHAKGMKVCLRPMLECKDGYGRLAVWLPVAGGKRMFGRCSTARAEWFESLRKRSAYYARLARETGCEAFCIDSELDRMVEENDLWKGVVDAVRKEYKGPVTSCHTLHTGTIDFLKTLADPGHWFHSLDYLSISYYCPARRKDEAGKVLTVDDMVRNLQEAKKKMKAIADACGKPIIFGECGCSSIKDGATSPSATSPTAVPDEDEQAMYMEALFRTFAGEDWCRGFTWWKWDQHSLQRADTTSEQVRKTDFTIHGKKAEGVFRKWASEGSRSPERYSPMVCPN